VIEAATATVVEKEDEVAGDVARSKRYSDKRKEERVRREKEKQERLLRKLQQPEGDRGEATAAAAATAVIMDIRLVCARNYCFETSRIYRIVINGSIFYTCPSLLAS
jgi:hypothetical protein